MQTQLLAPAGDLEKLKVAVAYGADEVYLGLDRFSLRNFARNFTLDEAETAFRYLHQHQKKGYVTLNIYPFEHEYNDLLHCAHQLQDMGADGVIISDLGLLQQLKTSGVTLPIHISTQANTLSSQTAMVYRSLGATRVNLARELSLAQIETLCHHADGIETEVFVHGAVCFSYSGRCAISDYLTGRRANRGECTHPCRWQYTLIEKERPDEPLMAAEDDRGLYLFNSKDLALFSYVPQLQKAGITSLKIEGRMKTIHYLASVTSLYRRILDGESISRDHVMALLKRVMNRGYSEGFMKGHTTADDMRFFENEQRSEWIFLGIVVETTDQECIMDIRNQVRAGGQIEILTPDGHVHTRTLPSPLQTTQFENGTVFNHGKHLRLPFPLPLYTIVRETRG